MTMSESPENKSKKKEKIKKDIKDSAEFKKVFGFEGILIGFNKINLMCNACLFEPKSYW